MARKGWEQLSEGYRGRLQRSGITREMYDAGVDLRQARGHTRAVLEDETRRPANRRGWEQLSEGYRDRLVRAGINRQAYEQGATLKRARGHAGPEAVAFGTMPPMRPDQIEAEVRAAGGPYEGLLDAGVLDDAAAWALSQSGTPPPDQWTFVSIQLSDGQEPNTVVIGNSRGDTWSVDVLDGSPTWSIYELGRDVDADVEVKSGGAE